MIYLTPLSWQMPGFLMKGIRKGLRREFDREPSRVEITGGYTEPDSVQRRSRLMHTVSFYYGFAQAFKYLLQNSSDIKARKRLKAIESLIGLIQNFPYEDPQYEKLQEDMERVRAKFRQVCSLLNVATDFKEYVSGSTGMSF
uniref:Interleukin-6 n=1 Tax=Cyprinus carpio TaxID=7962 RepID=A0A8C1P8Q7_CYPCA